ncbi:MAG: adenylosuccinate lyase, partial [Chitinophagaceae bacterium]
MELSTLTALSPIDGRYRRQVQGLADYFSEYALMKYRVRVEIAYLLFLAQKRFFRLPAATARHLQALEADFGPEEAARIKAIEATTNHDVKAVEYFLKEELEKAGGAAAKEWVHFGLT